jgi:hypothetical protein
MTQPVSFVRTIAAVAEMLGESEELLWELSDEMDKYDGKIWVGDALGNVAFVACSALAINGK